MELHTQWADRIVSTSQGLLQNAFSKRGVEYPIKLFKEWGGISCSFLCPDTWITLGVAVMDFLPKQPGVHLSWLATHHDYWGGGISTHMIGYLQSKFPRITLFNTTSNERGAALYKKMGFKVVRLDKETFKNPRHFLTWVRKD